MTDKITLDVNGSIATLTNRNVEKHNAFDDEMDADLTPLRAADPFAAAWEAILQSTAEPVQMFPLL